MVSDKYVLLSGKLTSAYPPALLFYDPSTHSFRLVSYNLRYDCKPDRIAVKDSIAKLPDPTSQPRYLSLAGKEQPWSSRRVRIAQDLLSEGIALAGTRHYPRYPPR